VISDPLSCFISLSLCGVSQWLKLFVIALDIRLKKSQMKSRKPVDLTSWKKSWLRRSQVDATAPPRTQKGDDVCPMSTVLWTKQWESQMKKPSQT